MPLGDALNLQQQDRQRQRRLTRSRVPSIDPVQSRPEPPRDEQQLVQQVLEQHLLHQRGRVVGRLEAADRQVRQVKLWLATGRHHGLEPHAHEDAPAEPVHHVEQPHVARDELSAQRTVHGLRLAHQLLLEHRQLRGQWDLVQAVDRLAGVGALVGGHGGRGRYRGGCLRVQVDQALQRREDVFQEAVLQVPRAKVGEVFGQRPVLLDVVCSRSGRCPGLDTSASTDVAGVVSDSRVDWPLPALVESGGGTAVSSPPSTENHSKPCIGSCWSSPLPNESTCHGSPLFSSPYRGAENSAGTDMSVAAWRRGRDTDAFAVAVPIGLNTQEAFILEQRVHTALPATLGHRSFCEWQRSHASLVLVGPGILFNV
ncbi:hypothetical protein M0657_007853 [Pyricularia oryzae]|nr:hypothetical protein M9X92_007578 [Pyricularia oryzae]KAI7917936.1 hypothetical protein M0657_007853 [Pyricularia oryzae]